MFPLSLQKDKNAMTRIEGGLKDQFTGLNSSSKLLDFYPLENKRFVNEIFMTYIIRGTTGYPLEILVKFYSNRNLDGDDQKPEVQYSRLECNRNAPTSLGTQSSDLVQGTFLKSP